MAGWPGRPGRAAGLRSSKKPRHVDAIFHLLTARPRHDGVEWNSFRVRDPRARDLGFADASANPRL
jgi:hypothetical protein